VHPRGETQFVWHLLNITHHNHNNAGMHRSTYNALREGQQWMKWNIWFWQLPPTISFATRSSLTQYSSTREKAFCQIACSRQWEQGSWYNSQEHFTCPSYSSSCWVELIMWLFSRSSLTWQRKTTQRDQSTVTVITVWVVMFQLSPLQEVMEGCPCMVRVRKHLCCPSSVTPSSHYTDITSTQIVAMTVAIFQ
jgi:hypothetical protein